MKTTTEDTLENLQTAKRSCINTGQDDLSTGQADRHANSPG